MEKSEIIEVVVREREAEGENYFDIDTAKVSECFPEVYETLIEMYEEFVADDGNEATKEQLEEWKEEGNVTFYFTEGGVNYTAWTTQNEKNNQDTWFSDSWEDIIENGELDNYLRLI